MTSRCYQAGDVVFDWIVLPGKGHTVTEIPDVHIHDLWHTFASLSLSFDNRRRSARLLDTGVSVCGPVCPGTVILATCEFRSWIVPKCLEGLVGRLFALGIVGAHHLFLVAWRLHVGRAFGPILAWRHDAQHQHSEIGAVARSLPELS